MIKYPRTLAMTGKSRRDLQQKRGAGRCEAPWDAPKAPMSRGAEMPCRTPPLPGQERGASPGPEFRWHHGQKFALSLHGSGRFLVLVHTI